MGGGGGAAHVNICKNFHGHNIELYAKGSIVWQKKEALQGEKM